MARQGVETLRFAPPQCLIGFYISVNKSHIGNRQNSDLIPYLTYQPDITPLLTKQSVGPRLGWVPFIVNLPAYPLRSTEDYYRIVTFDDGLKMFHFMG